MVGSVRRDTFLGKLRPRFLGTDDLYRDGRKVGDDASVCQLMADLGQADGRFQCLATMSLPHGQLTAQGLITHNEGGSEPFTVAITGGTGAYRTAHGGGLESVAAAWTCRPPCLVVLHGCE